MRTRVFIRSYLRESIRTKERMLEKNMDSIVRVADALVETYWKNGGTVYLFGNGGSSCDAQHFAEELTSAFRIIERWSLPAHALSDNGAVLTAIGNDYGFENVFARQIAGVAKATDLVMAFSTRGNSSNILKAVEVAKGRGIKTVGFIGAGGGKLAGLVDIPVIVPSDSVSHIQECHITIAHALCAVLEELFFKE